MLSIDDDLDGEGWNFVSVLGFDVVRDVPGPLRNPQFRELLDGWDQSGDASHFHLFDDFNYNVVGEDDTVQGAPEYGTRKSVTSYVYDSAAPHTNDAAAGILSQRFVVPVDAIALRFNVHGGRLGRIELRDGTQRLQTASGVDDNNVKLPVSWDLKPYRGRTLELSLVDDTVSGTWTFVSSSGFDLITSYNGP